MKTAKTQRMNEKPEIDDELRIMAERGSWIIKSYYEEVSEDVLLVVLRV